MASLLFDKESEHYFVRFRYAGRSFKRSLSTPERKIAFASLARIEETLMLIGSGRLEVPEDADPAEFILSDGKRLAPVAAKKPLTLGELVQAYQAQRITVAVEWGPLSPHFERRKPYDDRKHKQCEI